MIIHTVAFSLKHASNSAEEKDFISAGMALAELPMVRNFNCFRQVGEKSDLDFCFSMEFWTQDAYREYSENPVHTDFVASRWILEVEDFLELDYVEYANT